MTQTPFDFMIPKTTWEPVNMNTLPDWKDAKRIGLDIETRDPNLRELGPGNFRRDGHIVGISFAIEDGPSAYLPIAHQGGDNLPQEKVMDYLRDNMKSFRGSIVGANLGYDLGWMNAEPYGLPLHDDRIKYLDVQHAASLIYELHLKYNLNAIAERLGIPGKDETVLKQYAAAYGVDPKKDLWRLPARAVANYAVQDVRLPLTILRRQEREIEAEEIEQIWGLETAVLPILVRMRKRGVRVDLNKVDAIAQWCYQQETELMSKVHHLTGVQVAPEDVWKGAAMARALTKVGHPLPKLASGEYSVTDATLKQCGEAGAALNRSRKLNKLRTTFCARVKKYQVNGRVHCMFHQLRNTKDDGDEESKGARYGRFSSEHYNVQQEPARDDEFGAEWRSIYIPDEGAEWVCSDWSQQEPRVAVHYAEALGLPGAKEFGDRYRSDPRTDCHQMLADISGIQRKIVKNYFNGSIYGMGDAKLCKAMGHPTMMKERDGKRYEGAGPEGQKIIDKFRDSLPWVRLLTREAAKVAEKKKHVWTILRRKCHFEKDSQGNVMGTHKAFSRIGQGSAADQMKKTLVAADAAGIPIQLAIHDEFDFSCHDRKQAKMLKELQETTVKFSVPMLVDVEIGPNWGYCKKVDL